MHIIVIPNILLYAGYNKTPAPFIRDDDKNNIPCYFSRWNARGIYIPIARYNKRGYTIDAVGNYTVYDIIRGF